MFQLVARFPGLEATVNLQEQRVVLHQDGEIDAFRKHCLLHGLDDIGMTLQYIRDIDAFEKSHDVQIARVGA